MRYFITGARGFVMSVFIKRILDKFPQASITAIDVSKPDDLLICYLGPDVHRVDFHQMDIRDQDAIEAVLTVAQPEVVIHGATVTHVPEWEEVDPSRYIDVNVMGTVRLMEAVRKSSCVRRIVHASSAAVYGGGKGVENPIPERAPTMPDEMYGISKTAAEMIVNRYGELYNLETPTARFTKVFGPMERPSPGRASMSLPFHLASAVVSGSPVTLSERSMHASGDWISAVDVAEALVTLSSAEQVRSTTYHLASGILTPVKDLIAMFDAEAILALADKADVDLDPDSISGKNGAYQISSARQDLNWIPRPLSEQISEYIEWFRNNPDVLAPHLKPSASQGK
ncbi:NAD(P)-dependent oxidoreductase [Salinicola sp. MIT1003]|uniref:NAD-dependent epimerase/dehydratase family protein n=1 Tax=Salinicola sp. MIT1003 TaxID=1882734 RepID=UPI0008DC6CFB|nr:NAD(P)-dependent oxidoreductase [Salinicola sp. MIT1003]OHZ01622.1 hypothetical protein BC443_11375 [Salinicola sp. MIT1003]